MESSQVEKNNFAILYVEDEPETRGLIAKALAEEYPDFSFYIATDGAEGLELFRMHRPELVITDMRMPVMDGLRLAGDIKAIDSETDIIALTAYSDTSFLLSAIEVGFSHYVLKPIDFNKLFAAIEKSLHVLSLKRQVNEQNEQIRQFAAELEKRVEDRTSQLEASRNEVEKRNMKLQELTSELKGSRDRYWNLYNWSPLGYLSLDEQFTIREINITGAKILGSRRAPLLGSPIAQYLSPENMALLADSFRECRQAKHAVTELRIVIQETKHLYVQLHCVPYTPPGGKVKLYRIAIIDVTNLKEAEAKLHRLNRLYAMLSATGKAIVHAAGQKDLFQEVCRIAVEEGGFAQACIGLIDAEGREVHPVASCADGPKHERQPFTCFAEKLDEICPVTTAIRENSYFVINDCLNDPAAGYSRRIAETFGFRSTAAFSLQVEGKVVGALNIFSREVGYFDQQMIDLLNQMARDISFALESMEKGLRAREAEEALLRETVEKLAALQELRKRDQMLIQQSHFAAMGEFMSTVAHHWRQPLNSLGLLVQGLSFRSKKDGLTQELLDDTTANAMQMIGSLSRTIDNFGYYFKSGEERTVFNAKEVMERAFALIEGSITEQRVNLGVVMEGDVPIEGVQREFFQVLLNILMNAVDISLERKVTEPKIIVRMFREGGKSVITLADNAGGIPEEIIGRIFEPYFTTKKTSHGSGVGLYMAKIVIERNMNGVLSVRNIGDGAEFRIEI